MPVVLPEGDTEKTRRVLIEFMVGQEQDFPCPPDDSWKGRMRALVEKYVDPDVVVRTFRCSTPGGTDTLTF